MAAPMVRQILAQRARNSRVFSSYRSSFSTETSQSKPNEVDELVNNPYLDKYAEKLQKVESSDPDSFKSKLVDLKEAKKKKKWRDEQEPLQPAKSAKPQPKLPKLLKPSRDNLPNKGLDAIMKIDLIRDLPKAEIQKIWTQYHAKRDCISAVIPGTVYDKIHKMSLENPLFLYPVPKKSGYEFFFAQFDNHMCYFTSLINYQAYQENAPVLLSLTHFTELQAEKGVVLMRGEMDTNLVSVQDAQFLANELQLYYATDNAERQQLLKTFNHNQEQFKHTDVIEQLQKTTFELPTSTSSEKGS
ncbi:ATP synthase mitochondrial F1 complex assembly factor 1-like isoform X1 [Asterias rubens]|uniref:ATP synthase mitochondrial F1 complex assembly factor 1-like isoform X1 n=1 Tax=Asterias rubens TaxID=7604 RepID=UPI00145524A2|nr:ATP synthase mitochondrial F1 complex assembly factor 1-like isoform X1 [Asterias rubens]